MRLIYVLMLLWLTAALSAQVTVSASIGLADDYCTGPDPQADCVNVPIANNSLVYQPGIDGDILVTYRLTNNSSSTITQAQITDSDRGTVVPVTTINLPPGDSLSTNRLYPAENSPRSVTSTVSATVQNSAGNFNTVTSTYEFEVVAPELMVTEFGIGRTKDAGVCNQNDSNPVCFSLDGTTSITVGARDSISAYFQWQNVGDGIIDNISFDDSNSPPNQGIVEADRPQDLNPNGISFGTAFFVAPDQPGNYNRTLTLTSTDYAGNTSTTTANYTLIVTAPELMVTEFGIGRTKNAGVCNQNDSNPVCFSLDGTTSITVGARDSISAYFQWQNVGDGIIDNISFDDSNTPPNEGIVESDRPQDLDPNEISFGTAFFVAPDQTGTYNRTLTLTSTDLGGNTSTTTANYTLIVTAPELMVTEFGIGRTKDAGVCNQNDSNPVCFSLDGTTSITVGARDSISAYFQWQNVGDGIIDNISFDDSNTPPNEGIVESDRPQDMDPNEISFGTAFFVAPDQPGTYNRTLTLTSTDYGGNSSTTTANYILIVTAPELMVTEFGIGRTKNAGVCNQNDSNPVCFSLDGTTSITVGARDSVSAYFQWQNVGDGIIDNISFDDSNTPPNEGIVESDRPQDLDPNEISFGTAFFLSPDQPGTYNRTLTLTSTDLGGNTSTTTTNYTLIVDCSVSDEAPPVALCRDRTFTIAEGDTQTITMGDLNNGSSDNCGGLSGGSLSQTSFDCSHEGMNTVTLTATDNSGNTASCTSVVTIVVTNAIATGQVNQCVTSTVDVSTASPQEWVPLITPLGRLIGEVAIGMNTNLHTAVAELYRSSNQVVMAGGQAVLGKQVNIFFRNAGGAVVQPNNSPVYVRLYYTENEADGLMAATPGSSPSTFTLVKTSDGCGNPYSGANASQMNTSLQTSGCTNSDYYLEFFTANFSSFYLFADASILPVELAAFSARLNQGNRRVELAWNTASERENRYFEVQKSEDGASFRKIGEVAGAGNTSTGAHYAFTDDQPTTGLNYYRLRQVDYDGTESLSEIRQVLLTRNDDKQLLIYPNPVADRLALLNFGGGKLEIYSQLGRKMLSGTFAAGEPVAVRHLPAGVYLLRLKAGSVVNSIKWIKL